VFLANNIVAGVLVLVGIMICSRISALAAFSGSAIGAGVAALVGCNRDAIENGIYGFNSALTLAAMLMFYVPSIGSISVGIIASIITVLIQLALQTSLEPTGLPAMTLPFCLAALAFIVIQGTTSSVISVPLSAMTTPEDHLTRVKRLSDGFELLYGAIRSSSYRGSTKRRRSWLISKKESRLDSALNDYDEAVHGVDEEGKGLLARMCQRCRRKRDLRDGVQKMSFRMSFALNKSGSLLYGDKEKEMFAHMFCYIDTGEEYEITKAQFKGFLESIGFSDPVGLDFACEAFQLMDLDSSGDIGE